MCPPAKAPPTGPLLRFGGDWTERKLKALQKYLAAYTRILSKQNFKFAFIDAFAGTGRRDPRKPSFENLDLPGLDSEDARPFLEGSARVALATKPEFGRYIFIEKSRSRFRELSKLGSEFLEKKDRIQLIRGEANAVLADLCEKDWRQHRAVLFLDPFGMQVDWKTIAAIAETKAIDTWILLPISAVIRLLKRNAKIPRAWSQKLDDFFGTDTWRKHFYGIEPDGELFELPEGGARKTATYDQIAAFFIERLKRVFPFVSDQVLMLRNSKESPLFALVFAAANKTAVKIASDVLREEDKK